jgi:hypothetical protein
LTYEVGFSRRIRDAVDARITERHTLGDEQIEKRVHERQTGAPTEWAQEPF